MVSYVLLIVIAIGIAVGVYAFISAMVPRATDKCPSETALIIQDYQCDPALKTINLTLKNKGLFSLNGYYITASNQSGRMPTIKINSTEGGEGQVDFGAFPLAPNNISTEGFDYSALNTLKKIGITPYRTNSKGKISICSDAVIEQEMNDC